jgi:hypothetical protein
MRYFGAGVYTSLTYHPDHTFFEAGAYKSFGIRKVGYFTALAKYYNYQEIQGIIFSIIFNIFGTHYYCCSYPGIGYFHLNLLK